MTEAIVAEGRFSFSEDDGDSWPSVGPVCDASKLSDDYIRSLGFTGTFVGMACQDLQNRTAVAAFHSFLYEPRSI